MLKKVIDLTKSIILRLALIKSFWIKTETEEVFGIIRRPLERHKNAGANLTNPLQCAPCHN